MAVAGAPPSGSPTKPWTGAVWILGYTRTGSLTVIPARVVNRENATVGGTLDIAIKVPISPGLSGSPVVDEEGELIGIVVAKSLDDLVIYATCVTQALLDGLSSSPQEGG